MFLHLSIMYLKCSVDLHLFIFYISVVSEKHSCQPDLAHAAAVDTRPFVFVAVISVPLLVNKTEYYIINICSVYDKIWWKLLRMRAIPILYTPLSSSDDLPLSHVYSVYTLMDNFEFSEMSVLARIHSCKQHLIMS